MKTMQEEFRTVHVAFNPVEVQAKPLAEAPYDSIRANWMLYLVVGMVYAAIVFGGLMAYWQVIL
jgi:hypothetical protein